MEVSCVGRSLANEVSNELRKRYASEPWCEKLDDIGDIVAAACLAHDLGNPPFGHSGETAIATFFSEGEGVSLRSELSDEEWSDLIHFEGNANSLRLLINQFKGRRPGGFAMTYSTLASIVKYPYESTLAGDANKFGFFISEKKDFERIATELGILPRYGANGEIAFVRHPLVYIVEAADDICYEVMDIEDAHKLKILTTDEVTDLLMGFFDDDRKQHMFDVMKNVEDPNEKVSYMRSCVIGQLVRRCAEVFVTHEDEILEGRFKGSLISHMGLEGVWEAVQVWLRGISQVFLIDSWVTGLLFFLGLAVSSRWAALWALVGSALSMGMAVVMGMPVEHIDQGLYSFSAVLTAIALASVFYKPSWRSAMWATLGILVTVVVQAAMNVWVQPFGVATLTAPFCITTWLFLLPLLKFDEQHPDHSQWHHRS